eukprot:scaffold1444_cov134-Isochrysis_galbana.AAC.1
MAEAASGWLIGKPIISTDPCSRFSHAATQGWGLGFCRAEKHVVSTLTVIWSRGVSFASRAYSSGIGEREALSSRSFV